MSHDSILAFFDSSIPYLPELLCEGEVLDGGPAREDLGELALRELLHPRHVTRVEQDPEDGNDLNCDSVLTSL